MSHRYSAVGWNRQKRLYDRWLLAGVLAFLLVFILGGALAQPGITLETLLIRGFGLAALVLLHLILCIGPLCRLDARWLPLLYNRRHMGVCFFVLALAHGVFALVQYHALGNLSPLRSLFLSNTQFDSIAQFPFQPLGFLALGIFFLMAATSHDFWLANLGAPVWKALHMGVYIGWFLVLGHVFLGFLQAETGVALTALFVAGALLVAGLHLAAAGREGALDHAGDYPVDELGYADLCEADEIPDGCARTFVLSGERVAVFRKGSAFSALSAVCQHQNGPLGEGRVIDGLVTCPWHGYQYRPEDGCSPPPFGEKLPTFRIRIQGTRVRVHPEPLPAGTAVTPATPERGA